MFTPILRRPNLALPMFSAMLLLSLSSNPSQAQAPSPLASKLTPGRAMERITPTATVVSTAHYQVVLPLSCNGSSASGAFCSGHFPAVANRRRLNLTRMSCYMRSSTYATYANGKIVLHAADGSSSLVQYLAADYTTEWGYHLINQGIDVQVTPKQNISVALLLASGGQTQEAACTAHGTLETLQ
jgi:hypothetical protein